MKSRSTRGFWHRFDKLPADVQEGARKAYRQFKVDPAHPGLHFKRVSNRRPVYSARIGVQYRAVGLLEDDTITWFWIGSHADYDKLLGK